MKIMKLLNILLLAVCLTGMAIHPSSAQSEKVRSFNLKKGEVFDVFFLIQKKDTEDKLKKYFSSAVPFVAKLGYKSIPGFRIKETPMKGNYHPQLMLFGQWPSVKSREETMESLIKEIPDFHEQRREIWSTFDMTYYELKKDLSFEIDISKYNVATAYWGNDEEESEKYTKDWLKAVKKAGGTVKVKLTDGISPSNYNYNPDYMMIVEWDSKEKYTEFSKQFSNKDSDIFQQVNEFKIH